MAPLAHGRRAATLDVSGLDLKTVAVLARVLDERLAAVATYGTCPTCGQSEAQAFLAQLRAIVAKGSGP